MLASPVRPSALLSVLGTRLNFNLGTVPARPLLGLASAAAGLSGDAAIVCVLFC